MEQLPEAGPERIHKLEEEVFALRDTVSRFAELMLVELKRLHPPEAPSAPQQPVMVSVAGMAPIPISLPTPQSHQFARGWVLPELFRDLSTTFKMYFDPRYRLRRTTQLFIPMILFIFFLNHLFWKAIPIPLVDMIGEKLCDIVLAVLLYKVLFREMLRYREVIAQFHAVDPSHQRTKIIHSDGDSPTTAMDIES